MQEAPAAIVPAGVVPPKEAVTEKVPAEPEAVIVPHVKASNVPLAVAAPVKMLVLPVAEIETAAPVLVLVPVSVE